MEDAVEIVQRAVEMGKKICIYGDYDVDGVIARPTTSKRHLRLVVGHGDQSLPALWWWAGSVPERGNVDLFYSVGINRWKGKEEVQLVIKGLLAPEAEEVPVEKEKRCQEL